MLFIVFYFLIALSVTPVDPEVYCETITQTSCNMDPICVWDCEEHKCVQTSDANERCGTMSAYGGMPGAMGGMPGAMGTMGRMPGAMGGMPMGGMTGMPMGGMTGTMGRMPMGGMTGSMGAMPQTGMYPQQYPGQIPSYPMQRQPGAVYPGQTSMYSQRNSMYPQGRMPGGMMMQPGMGGMAGMMPRNGMVPQPGMMPPRGPITPIHLTKTRKTGENTTSPKLNKPAYGTYPTTGVGSYPGQYPNTYGTGAYPSTYGRTTGTYNNPYAYGYRKKKYTISSTFTYALLIITPFLLICSFCVGKFLGSKPAVYVNNSELMHPMHMESHSNVHPIQMDVTDLSRGQPDADIVETIRRSQSAHRSKTRY